LYNHWKSATRLGLAWILFAFIALCVSLFGLLSWQVGVVTLVAVVLTHGAIMHSTNVPDVGFEWGMALIMTLVFGYIPAVLGYPGVLGVLLVYSILALMLFGSAIYWRQRRRRELGSP